MPYFGKVGPNSAKGASTAQWIRCKAALINILQCKLNCSLAQIQADLPVGGGGVFESLSVGVLDCLVDEGSRW